MTKFFTMPTYSHDIEESSKKIQARLLNSSYSFNPKTTEDIDLINTCTIQFKTELKKLENIDKRIIAGFAVGAGALFFSYLLPLTMVGIAGFAYSAYYANERRHVETEYRKALENLEGCFELTLVNADWGKSSSFGLSKPTYIGVKECTPVVEMFRAIAPMMNEEQLRDILDDNIEADFIQLAEKQKQGIASTLLDRPLNQEERNVYYGIYGYKQGKPSDVFTGLYFLACQVFTKVKHFVENKWNDYSHSKSQEDVVLSHTPQ